MTKKPPKKKSSRKRQVGGSMYAVTTLTDAEITRARRVVGAHATGPDEEITFLDALGLMGTP